MKRYLYQILINRHIEKAAVYREMAFHHSAVGKDKLSDKYYKKATAHNKKINKYLNKIDNINKQN